MVVRPEAGSQGEPAPSPVCSLVLVLGVSQSPVLLFQVSAGELERLMVRLPSMFRQELSGVGATLEKRWKFCGFDSLGSA